VEHDVIVGAYAHLAPGAVVGGGTRVGRGAFIGLGARVRDHVTVGDRAVVAMGATVVGNVDAERMVLGMPAAEADERHG
jgi:acetyltransferase EpsM